MTSINVDSKNKNYSSVDGVVFNKNKTEIVAFPRGRKGNYSIPNSVTSIKTSSFSNCANLTGISIPNSVTSIEISAFRFCTSLTSVSIPNSVTYIGGDAFYTCKNLTSIYIPKSVIKIGDFEQDGEIIDYYGKATIFDFCDNLTVYGIPGSLIEEHANRFSINFKDFNTLSLAEQITLFAAAANTASSAALTVVSSDDSAAKTYTATYDENTKKFIFDYTPKAKDKIVFTAVSKLTGETVKTFEHTFTQTEIVKGANALAVSVSGDINKNVDLAVETVAVGNNDNTDNDTPIIPDTKNTKYGDLDGDGKVTSADALLVLRASVNLEKFDNTKTKLADVDGDGVITSSDSLFILRNSVGLKDNGTLFN